MKQILRFGLGIVAVVALFYGLIHLLTSTVGFSADRFFDAVKERDLDRAYARLSDDFQASARKEELDAYLERSGLDQVESVDWGIRTIGGGRGALFGTVNTVTGTSIPFQMRFVRDGFVWRVHSIREPLADPPDDGPGGQVPGRERLVEMVHETTLLFFRSANTGSMEGFLPHIAVIWRDETSVEKLNENYGMFLGLGFDLDYLEPIGPVIVSGPTFIENETLEISGFYDTSPSKIIFRQRYDYQGLDWRLSGLRIEVR